MFLGLLYRFGMPFFWEAQRDKLCFFVVFNSAAPLYYHIVAAQRQPTYAFPKTE